MIDSFAELRFFNIKPQKFIYISVSIFILLTILCSFKKVNNYKTFNLLKSNNEYYITCEDECNLIKENSEIYYRNKIYNYKITLESENLYKINIDENGEFDDVNEIGIFKKRTTAIKSLFNIFKRKGVL